VAAVALLAAEISEFPQGDTFNAMPS
jgi:hypothetical protein